MILSDNETKYDLLNNAAIAKTIVTLITESADQPVSIGIHGDWGAGKSSILEMIEDQLEDPKDKATSKFCCIRFNGWKHQGFEDSKIALMSAIVSELVEKEKLTEKAKDTIEKLWKNINWMSVAKAAGKTAFGLATGVAPLTLLTSAFDMLKKAGTSEDGIASAIESIGGYLSDAKVNKDTSSNTEFTEFQKNFSELLEKAAIKKLVILIDDLDRCLPNVAIDILEAVRLFMFTKETAFVIAADETMIRYAVKKHFPDVVDDNKYNAGVEFANKYLEKLIQVPFRIPALGDVEACNYITLLFVGSVLDSKNKQYNALCKEAVSRMQKPWDVTTLKIPDIQTILQDDYGKAEEKILIASQIGHLLSNNTEGNPRKIKRFINMLLIRYMIAENRGFGSEINMSVLAKMMIAEYYFPDFYKHLPEHLSSDGVWVEYDKIVENTETEDRKKGSDALEASNWFEIKGLNDWLKSEPSISGKDLRPYYYACREKIDYFAGRPLSNDLTAIIELLQGQDMVFAQHVDDIAGLSESDAEQVFDIISQKIMEHGKFDSKPKGVDGIRFLTQHKEFLRKKLADFVCGLPKAEVGVWVVNGWDKAIPASAPEHTQLDSYMNDLSETGNQIVASTIKAVRRK